MQVRFSIGAARSRERIASLGGLGLLEGYRVHVSDRGEGARRAKSNAEVLRRLATSLGAQVCRRLTPALVLVNGTVALRP